LNQCSINYFQYTHILRSYPSSRRRNAVQKWRQVFIAAWERFEQYKLNSTVLYGRDSRTRRKAWVTDWRSGSTWLNQELPGCLLHVSLLHLFIEILF